MAGSSIPTKNVVENNIGFGHEAIYQLHDWNTLGDFGGAGKANQIDPISTRAVRSWLKIQALSRVLRLADLYCARLLRDPFSVCSRSIIGGQISR